jgi:hypothetical protein
MKRFKKIILSSLFVVIGGMSLRGMEQRIFHALPLLYTVPRLTEPFEMYDDCGNWHRRYEPTIKHTDFYDSLCRIYIRVCLDLFPGLSRVALSQEYSAYTRIFSKYVGIQYEVADLQAEETIIEKSGKEYIQYYNVPILTAPYEIYDSFGQSYFRYESLQGLPGHFFDHLARIFIRVCPNYFRPKKATQCCESDFPKPESGRWADVEEGEEDEPMGWGKVPDCARPELSKKEYPSLPGSK